MLVGVQFNKTVQAGSPATYPTTTSCCNSFRPHPNLTRLNKQLGFTAVEYGVGSGLYFLGYGLFILPSTFITIKYGARRWVGAMTAATGVLGMCHALIANRPGFFLLRCLLGLAEAGGGSSAGHLLAQFYPKNRWESGWAQSRVGGRRVVELI